MAGLVACGYRGPWRWSNLDWELSFYRVWARWPAAQRDAALLPTFQLGGHGRTSEPREMLWQLKRTSPFHAYGDDLLPAHPRGMDPVEYLEIHVEVATPSEWVALARDFLSEVGH